MGKPTKRASEMRRMLEEFRASGLTRREFCANRGIPLTTFDYCRQLLATLRLVKGAGIASGDAFGKSPS